MLIPLNDIALPTPIVTDSTLRDHSLNREDRRALADALGTEGYIFGHYTSYAVTDKGTHEKSANYAVIPNQYFVYAYRLYGFASELSKYFHYFDALRSSARELVGTAHEIVANILANPSMVEVFQYDEDIEHFARFLDKEDASYRLGAKRLINDEGKPRATKDCFASVILRTINLPAVSSGIFGQLVYDLSQAPTTYKSLTEKYTTEVWDNEVASLTPRGRLPLPKPFIILAGISGTGKSRFVRRQAAAAGVDGNFCMVPVRPDWHEPSDLLGYASRLSGAVEYVATDTLRFIVQAWKALKQHGFELYSDGGSVVLEGSSDALERIPPYWLCLDEMNLAPVEQYFADYLSILETRKWDWADERFSYSCDALLGAARLKELTTNKEGVGRLAHYLGLEINGADQSLWELFLDVGIAIPPQLMVVGTVNMDETTHGFSRKVLDRALTFDFGEFFPNVFDDFFAQKLDAKPLGFPHYSHVTREALSDTCDKNGSESIGFLEALNTQLKGTPFELAYRSLNELLLSVVCHQPQTKPELQAVWDDFLMHKVLPRIEGDADKLRVRAQDDSLLADVKNVLRTELSEIWTDGTVRPDFYRTQGGKTLDISCRSRVKLEWMESRLRSAGFTSFWP